MKVKQVQVKKKLSRTEFVRIQIQIWSTLSGIVLTETSLDSLVVLALLDRIELAAFCKLLTKTESTWYTRQLQLGLDDSNIKNKYIFSSEQSARNSVGKLVDLGFIIKSDKHLISLSKNLGVHIENGTLLDLQLLCYETN